MAKKNSVHSIIKTTSVFSTSFLSRVIPLLLQLLIVVILIGFLVGVVKTFIDLKILWTGSVEDGLRQLILNVLTLLAVIEVVKTVLSYLSDGRVKVTYIVDTVLIVMLNEVISSWFKGVGIEVWAALSLILVALIVVRILAIKFSPDTD